MENNQDAINKMADFYGKKREAMIESDLNFLERLNPECINKTLEIGEERTNRNDDRLIVPGRGDAGWPIKYTWYFSDIAELQEIIKEYWEILLPKNPEFYQDIIADKIADGAEPEEVEIEQYDCLADWVSERNSLFCCLCESGACTGE